MNQLGFDGFEEIPRSSARPIVAIDPAQTTNAQRVMDMARLGYLPEPVLDPTFGKHGGMWKRHVPFSLTRGDMHPLKARDLVLDFTALPFRDGAFASSLFDPPYKYHGGTSGDEMQDRFGVDVPHTMEEIDRFLTVGSKECARVSREFVIVKCQDQVCGGKKRWQTDLVTEAMQSVEWRLKDQLHLMNMTGLEQQEREQQHARGNYSTFLVFVPK